jgi:LEA14-like dessication related protein
MKKYIFLLLTACTFILSSCGGDFKEVTFSGIENVKIIKMSQQGIQAEISVKIKNSNKMAFHIYPTDLDATLNGLNAGKAELTNNIRIKPNSEEVYIFKIGSNFSNLTMTDLPKLMSILNSKSAKIGLKGNLKVGKLFYRRSFPVDFSKNVPLNFN